jgi:hypothetical protein
MKIQQSRGAARRLSNTAGARRKRLRREQDREYRQAELERKSVKRADPIKRAVEREQDKIARRCCRVMVDKKRKVELRIKDSNSRYLSRRMDGLQFAVREKGGIVIISYIIFYRLPRTVKNNSCRRNVRYIQTKSIA